MCCKMINDRTEQKVENIANNGLWQQIPRAPSNIRWLLWTKIHDNKKNIHFYFYWSCSHCDDRIVRPAQPRNRPQWSDGHTDKQGVCQLNKVAIPSRKGGLLRLVVDNNRRCRMRRKHVSRDAKSGLAVSLWLYLSLWPNFQRSSTRSCSLLTANRR